MTKDEALDLALEVLESERDKYLEWGDEDGAPEDVYDAITAIKQARALDKKAENARELGLDYEPVQDVSLIDEGKTAAQTAPVQGPSIRFNTAEALDKAKADRDKPVTPVEYIPVISEVGSDSNMVFPNTMYGLLPKGTGKITLHESKPAQQEPVAVVGEDKHGPFVDWLGDRSSFYERNPVGTKFYNTPPAAQRQWVGLDDTDIGDEYVRFEIQGGFNRFEYAVRAIEAKLKEKNT